MRAQAAALVKPCTRCGKGAETFIYDLNQYLFDIDRARQLTVDGREPVEVEDESVRISVEECTIDEDHVFHVDASIPGIIAHIFRTTADGRRVQAHLLIDGHHRAARCLAEQIPFCAYLLTEQE